MNLCIHCGESERLKHRRSCKGCRKLLDRARHYGITYQQVRDLLQDAECGICGTSDPKGVGFCIDHDHNTGDVRGILCFNCNTGIGQLHDDPTLLLNAISYLRMA